MQRLCKVQETQVKSTKARNYYLLDLEAANAYINKYYVHDLSALIDVSDLVHVIIHLICEKLIYCLA